MSVHTTTLSVKTRGDCDIVDITDSVRSALAASGIGDGLLTVFVVGSTAGVTTVEYEPGLVTDLQTLFEGVAPQGVAYAHDARWHDGNGHAHVRASLIGPSLTVPVVGGALCLGTWQQMILIDFDNRPRTREVVAQVTGE
jgi:secondary thiamine-phosphate synthase enzyme